MPFWLGELHGSRAGIIINPAVGQRGTGDPIGQGMEAISYLHTP
jgi:hypothetical protein